MGEKSKNIGEYGEEVVKNFLSLIGWHDISHGIQIPCKTRGHQSATKEQSKTHGIDFLYSYKSQLVDGELVNVLVSVKFKQTDYPNSATALFKSFMSDLANTMECFDKSDYKDSILQAQIPYNTHTDVGVLFFLCEPEDGEATNNDYISIVSNAKISIESTKTIHLVDNKRFGFVRDLMNYVTSLKDFEYSFFYPNIGQNINPTTRIDSGKTLPVEYVNSSVIPFKLENKNNNKEIAIFLGCIDNFEQDTFMRLLGLAKDLSKGWTGEVIIGFPNYNNLKHQNDVSIAKQGFAEPKFTEKVKVINFHKPLNI